MTQTWGAWLRNKRGTRGEPGFITQGELAQRMEVSRTYVAQLEDMAEPPTFPTRQKVHAALGTSENELIALGIVRGSTDASVSLRINETAPIDSFADASVKARFIDSLSDAQKALFFDLVSGVIRVDEIPIEPPTQGRRTGTS